jgi:3-methyladenine DNA glycosylase AlkC
VAVTALADAVAQVDPGFDRAAFVADALEGLAPLELKARIAHVADALARHLPHAFPQNAELVAEAAERAGLTGWTAWPATEYVGRHGLDHPAEALDALARLTGHASAEFAVRPFLLRHPELTLARVAEWSRSPDRHRRRLASEGMRPRLPWGQRLQAFVADPAPMLAVLDRLHTDPAEEVRRSVANHLNDIAKDHPQLAVDVARRWLADGTPETTALVRHALRTLVKAGDPAALAVLGHDPDVPVELVRLALVDAHVPLGGTLRFRAVLRSEAAKPVEVVVDYVVHHRLASGRHGPKVYKLARRVLSPGEEVELRGSRSFRPVTTRRHHPGEHLLEVQVNGRRLGSAPFLLVDRP